jgi:hypothetical protein
MESIVHIPLLVKGLSLNVNVRDKNLYENACFMTTQVSFVLEKLEI